MPGTILFRWITIGAVLAVALPVGAGEEELAPVHPVRQQLPSELMYRAPLAGGQPRFDRLTLHPELTVPVKRRGLAVALRLAYDLDELGLGGVLPYDDVLTLHRIEFGPYLTLPLDERASLSLDGMAVLSGDLSHARDENWQADIRLTYNHRPSNSTTVTLGFEASRLFGPLVPYPIVGVYLKDAIAPVRVRAALPRDAEVYVVLGSRMTLGLFTVFEGRYWWISAAENPHALTMQELRVGPRFYVRFLDWLALDLRAGVVALRRTKLLRDLDGGSERPESIVQGPGLFAGLSLPVHILNQTP